MSETRDQKVLPLWLWLHAMLLAGIGSVLSLLAAVLLDTPVTLLREILRDLAGLGAPLLFLTLLIALIYGLYLRPYRWSWEVLVLGAGLLLANDVFALEDRLGRAGTALPYISLLLVVAVALGLLVSMKEEVGPYRGPVGRVAFGAWFGVFVLVGTTFWWAFGDFLNVSVVALADVGQSASTPLGPLGASLPVWYLLPFYALGIAVTKMKLALALMFGAVAALMLLPWLCRSEARPFWQKGPTRWLVPVLLLVLFALGLNAAQPASIATRSISLGLGGLWLAILLIGLPLAHLRRAA